MEKFDLLIEKYKGNILKRATNLDCESILEYRLLNHILKYLNYGSTLIQQYEFEIIGNIYRTDFLLINAERKIVIECDGQEFHSKEEDALYDEWRDNLIIELGEIDVIYRFAFKDIFEEIVSVVDYLCSNEPSFFIKQESYYQKILIYESSFYSNRIWNGEGLLYVVKNKNSKFHKNRDIVKLKTILYSILHENKTIKEMIKEEIYRSSETINEIIYLIENKTNPNKERT